MKSRWHCKGCCTAQRDDRIYLVWSAVHVRVPHRESGLSRRGSHMHSTRFGEPLASPSRASRVAQRARRKSLRYRSSARYTVRADSRIDGNLLLRRSTASRCLVANVRTATRIDGERRRVLTRRIDLWPKWSAVGGNSISENGLSTSERAHAARRNGGE